MSKQPELSPWRTLAFLATVYVVIRIAIPWLNEIGVPFEIRAVLLAMLPYLGFRVGPYLFTRFRPQARKERHDETVA